MTRTVFETILGRIERQTAERNHSGSRRNTMSKNSLACLIAAALLCSSLPAWSQELPEGRGKDVVAASCNSCHPFYARLGAGYTPTGWRTVMQMMANHGVTLPPDQVATITEYLTKNFPEKAKPAGAVVAGPVKISFKEWQVPTPGSRPHDPLATADGALWYTGQMTNVLGRVDPKTGAIKEYPLKTPHSGPHGLDEDRAGSIWYTGNAGALIGKLDPKTGAVTEYKMPDPDVKDPHTLIFDQSGILWFTAQNANRLGRLDPKTGEIKLLTPPTPKSRPYGMAVSSKGTVFYVAFGTNRVGSVDPKTLEIREYVLPDPASRPRRIAMTSDDIVWYSDFSRGYLGRLDPATGKVTEWPSPSGSKSEPYGISAINDIIWYSESGTTPNTVVRFDPKTAKFQSWVIPGGGNIVRNTSVTRDGGFVLANSLVNKVTLVTISK
ncbi:MAG: cytochrome C [Candidatus Rokuibacteriota bacterium]|nr:MAG: cytochrome C [Candidatus Rokubacteria bacterium]